MDRGILSDVALLTHLSEEDRAAVIAAGSLVRLTKNQVLFHEGEPADAIFALLEGRMKLVRYSEKGRELLIHLVKPGQSFAEAALFGAGTYPATAEAIEPSECWRLPRERLLALLQTRPELGLAMLASMAMWTRRLAGKLQLLTQRRVEERLAVYLFSRTGGELPSPGETVSLGAPKHLVAAQCGTAPEVLSRTFKKLEDAEILRVGSDHVVVLDPTKLRDLAEWIGDGE
ncbi:MAG: Crp/Fnr family transcriptional regulator [Acidobacteria bacterium]|nr:Crp/Fnr family transcriptional regulator [Acidobacteriota bacterium]